MSLSERKVEEEGEKIDGSCGAVDGRVGVV